MKIAIIGLGLIGGSLLQALSTTEHEITGYDADAHTRQLAREATEGIDIPHSIRQATDRADIVVLAVPLPAIAHALSDIGEHPGLFTDVTSVKGQVAPLMAGRRFVGGHPMAGTEKSGFTHADATLFRNRPWALCLDPDTDPADWTTLSNLINELGAHVITITSIDHDNAVARVSHVPHLLAAAIAASAADPGTLALAAGSFRDGTRVAATAPALVAAMCSGNAHAVREALEEVIADLVAVREKLDSPRDVEEWLMRGYEARQRWLAMIDAQHP